MNIREETATSFVLRLSTLIFAFPEEAAGRVMVKEVALAEVTVALQDPTKTTFWPDVVLNPDPEMVTEVPAAPESGEKLVIAG